ncbi:voltage-gated chloride channel family protein [Clostridium fungisolvens]|uniref:Chloride/fluoride channel protein n=1 Tax=Clostridium fungisolvens TaxID=1604897 RepID=A0A6V8SLR0_9CLOT|nr:voltage-gated chloride channel family protein [Clostridium fungisolvens]GFP77492.1 Chloride/fluoride channel protein [Clostridium fungisolvens]
MKNIRKKFKDMLIFLGKKNSSVALGITLIKWIILGSIVGIVTGSAAALFLKSLELATNLRMQNSWLLLLLPIGGAFVSFLYSRYGKNSSKGNNLILEKINENSGRISMRMAPLVFIGTVITHLFGGSAGREGTGVQIGSTIAEGVGRFFKLDKIDTRIILMSGISSGFASVFGTPLAGTVFGLEVATLGIMSYEAMIPCFTASIVGDIISKAWGIQHIHYKILEVPELTSMTVVKIVFAAILFGLTSRLFSELTHKLKEVFTEAFKNPVIKSFIGGILVIILVYVVGTRDYLGLSIPLISDSFTSKVHPLAFLGKIAFTSLTLGAGFQGGEVTPLFVIGSTLGNSLSNILHMSPSFLAALGLIGVFTGATNTPIASFFLGIEMFGAQGIELMFMTCVISYIFSGHTGIYTSQKIGRSKSKIIEVPHNASLSYYRKKVSNKENLVSGVGSSF